MTTVYSDSIDHFYAVHDAQPQTAHDDPTIEEVLDHWITMNLVDADQARLRIRFMGKFRPPDPL